ncbi:AAA ATPase [Paenibacillus sp. FSL R7-269]|uniref:nSTAND3 domain-containing NTPase n=1 Tax=Paenibacillus sp. FSL R7-269 TaxID=1226755 RepID=UPI0003E1CB52|nr:restriction endonuclease [Paenibacillus sp. FSL R7-269]ETT55407.1 AAA ATPase [Paenibacillus sp. FSL R7-269]
MYNYHNLNDVEFEELCKDVMQRKLSAELRLFSKGRDGGIDLTDNAFNYNIIVQVKHYIRSSYASLRTALKNEVEKVNKWRPKQYYICCGMDLTSANIREIYEMFSEFMMTDHNIVTLNEIDDFLQKTENADIVRKHYKLWLYSSNILAEIYNQNIFVDCETLLSDVSEECKFFVPTHIYQVCMKHLIDYGTLMLTGGPGVGKTITSKMLVLYFATQGYRIRYTTNGDIANIKNSLSHDKEQKEVVLLDDCLGQHYFNMKQSQEDELLSLIKYTKLYTNKKLILNSRITIFNEAKERTYEFSNFFEQKKMVNYIINMDEITLLEKAKILYNHLKLKKIPADYYSSIIENKNYLKVVQHKNYTPRIIEHVTFEHNYSRVMPKLYFNFIVQNLTNPHDIWKNEFEQRLQNIDRAFLTTLYSLTDTYIEHDILKKCFLKRISTMNNIDFTIDQWSLVLSRLNQSIINIFDLKGKQLIGVINPSVNDYLKLVFTNNLLELNSIRNSICNALQFERCYTKEELPNIYKQLIIDETVHKIDFADKHQKDYFITSKISEHHIKNTNYTTIIFDYLSDSYCSNYSYVNCLNHFEVLSALMSNDFYKFYSIDQFIYSQDNISNLLEDVDLDELVMTINLLNEFFKAQETSPPWFEQICKEKLYESIMYYLECVDTSEYCDNYYMGDLISEHTRSYSDRFDEYIDKSSVVSDLEKKIISDIEDEVQEKLSSLEEKYRQLSQPPITYSVNTTDIENAFDSYFREPYEESYRSNTNQSFVSEIEAIFER